MIRVRTFPWGALALPLLPFLWGPATPHPLAAQEQEEILSYDVEVEVRDGGFMEVTETIQVRALGASIQRGIYRDFPTQFPRAWGLGSAVAPFEVRSVTRDGAPEPYAIETVGGPAGRSGVRVRIGNPNVLVSHGVHEYTIVYETARWVSFGIDSDRLDWNVTGNGWDFDIASATVAVRLPGSPLSEGVSLEAWTGPEGSTAQDASWSWDASTGTAHFRTTRPMGPYEGLTVRVSWPKGIVSPPTEAQLAAWFRLDWGGYVDAGVMLALVLAFYFLMWIQVGRDPASGTIVVRYEPPEGFSPAALGFLRERGYDETQVTAGLVSLAVKGAVTLEKDGRKWRITPTDGFDDFLPPEERRLYDKLVGGGKTLTLSGASNSRLRAGVKAFRTRLEQQLEKKYFLTNRRWFGAGAALSVLGFIALFWRARYGVPPEAWFMGVWLTFWSIGVGTLLYRTGTSWRQALTGDILSGAGALFMTLFSLPFLAAEVGVAWLLYQSVPRHLVVALVALGLLNVLFYHLLERPTLKGRGVLDQMEGFRRFLGATEGDRLDRLQAPERTLELFETFLPYAIALGVENRWAEGFQDVLTPAEAAAASRTMSWYSGGGSGSNLSGMTSALSSSLSSSLSASSASPSSGGGGGGGGGGGSSGGGGGGGGGGGW